MDKPNRYDGPCWRCGTKVPALAGTYSQEHHRSEHAPGQCKTTTKTWRQTEDARRMAEFQAANLALFTEAGYTITPSRRIEYADEIRGHGLRILVGGDKRGEVGQYGVRVFRDGELLGEDPEPCVPSMPGCDWFADRLAETRMLLDLINFYQEA